MSAWERVCVLACERGCVCTRVYLQVLIRPVRRTYFLVFHHFSHFLQRFDMLRWWNGKRSLSPPWEWDRTLFNSRKKYFTKSCFNLSRHVRYRCITWLSGQAPIHPLLASYVARTIAKSDNHYVACIIMGIFPSIIFYILRQHKSISRTQWTSSCWPLAFDVSQRHSGDSWRSIRLSRPWNDWNE